ncbi:MAG TPA: GNAT family N-acetyltransferase [Caulobacteraceae bacterium]|nr:GNAT family N-acetyltransferase [Caulobacteraceae bacterium]
MPFQLVTPDLDHLPEYVDALRRGWSPDNVRLEAAAREELDRIEADPEAFVRALDDREARGAPVTMPDGSVARRLPGVRRWFWDDGFCGSIGFRGLEEGSAELPPHVLGHIGYAVPPWRRGRGYAAQGLRAILPEAKALRLPWVDLTTDPDNIASQKVVIAAGGRLVERFRKPDVYGGGESLRWRIDL